MKLEQLQQQILAAKKIHIVGSSSQKTSEHDTTLDMSLYSGVVEYHPEELVLTVKAGTTLKEIAQVLAENNQALPFDMSNDIGTIGGAFAIGGAKLRDAVLGVKIIDGQGRILNFGGQVMKNVAGYDVSRLLVGSKGQLAAICEISFKVLPQNYIELSASPTKPTSQQSSSVRARIEQGIKQVFDPNGVFV